MNIFSNSQVFVCCVITKRDYSPTGAGNTYRKVVTVEGRRCGKGAVSI